MATLVMMVGGALTNALAFTGSNFIFSKLSSDAERKRHDLAIEKLQFDRDEWNEQRLKYLDYANNKLKEEANSEKQFRNVDDAMQEYYRLTGLTMDLNSIGPEPQLQDYLDADQLSTIQTGELMFMTAGLLVSGFIAYNYFKSNKKDV